MARIDIARPIDTSLSWDEKFHRTYTSRYMVIADKYVSPREISLADGLPGYGNSYVWYGHIDFWAFCKTLDLSRESKITHEGRERAKWILTYKHSSVPTDGSNDNQTQRENPLDDPPVVSGSFNSFSFPAIRDMSEDLIVNAANHPYVPPPNATGRIDTFKISYNTANLDLGFRSRYMDEEVVNELPIWGLQARQAKLVRWDYQVLRSGQVLTYIKNNFEFHISQKLTVSDLELICIGTAFHDKKGFYNVLPNSGERYYDGGLPEPAGVDGEGDPDGTYTPDQLLAIRLSEKKFMDGQDQPLAEPGKLQCNADKRPEGLPQLWNIYAIEKEMDFTLIPKMPTAGVPGPFVNDWPTS